MLGDWYIFVNVWSGKEPGPAILARRNRLRPTTSPQSGSRSSFLIPWFVLEVVGFRGSVGEIRGLERRFARPPAGATLAALHTLNPRNRHLPLAIGAYTPDPKPQTTPNPKLQGGGNTLGSTIQLAWIHTTETQSTQAQTQGIYTALWFENIHEQSNGFGAPLSRVHRLFSS